MPMEFVYMTSSDGLSYPQERSELETTVCTHAPYRPSTSLSSVRVCVCVWGGWVPGG